MGTNVVLSAVRARKRYGSSMVLHDVSLDVREGEVHALVGLNGAGKTTLMRSLLGMVDPDDGVVLVRGRKPSQMVAKDWAQVGHLVESSYAYPELTVSENLDIAGRAAGLPPSEAKQAAGRLIEEFVLERWATLPARKLSLGNRQRLGLAGAVIADPDILVLDEPTSALDPAGVMIVRKHLLRRAREDGITVLVSSHHLDEVARIADRISVLNRGRVIGNLQPTADDVEKRFFALIYSDDGVSL